VAIIGAFRVGKARTPSTPSPYFFAAMAIVFAVIGIFSILYFSVPPPIDFQ
jgi:hypothetical protein